MKKFMTIAAVACIAAASCNQAGTSTQNKKDSLSYVDERLAQFKSVKLTTDLSSLTEKEKQMLPLLIDAAKIMDELFWLQAYGNKDSLLNTIKDENTKQFVMVNYGPWDRLNGDTPFIADVGTKPLGATFYPVGMTKEELEKSGIIDKQNLYSVIKRDASGKLISVPYHVIFKPQLEKAAGLLRQAAAIADDTGLKNYLTLRADALVTDKYDASDRAWLDMKTNGIDIVIGPIENYEDKLFSARASYEGYVFVKDKVWSAKLAKYVAMLPQLQQGLPVDAKYKAETPGTESELNAYDVVYYAGDCNAGSKTIAVNLPNDEKIQVEKGTRRSQLKNAMKAKFDNIMLPIAKELIDESQIDKVKFDAFFSNVMFHEVAHGLGIKNTVNGKGTVRKALEEQSSALEEGKADILGLYMVTELLKKGELTGNIEEYYTTFMAGILRSVRFGASSAHGKANMLCFNFFKEKGAFEVAANGRYKVNYAKFASAMNELSAMILTLQGNGDKAGVEKVMKEKGNIDSALQASLDRLKAKGIPVDIIFEQGVEVLGLK